MLKTLAAMLQNWKPQVQVCKKAASVWWTCPYSQGKEDNAML